MEKPKNVKNANANVNESANKNNKQFDVSEDRNIWGQDVHVQGKRISVNLIYIYYFEQRHSTVLVRVQENAGKSLTKSFNIRIFFQLDESRI